MLYDAHVHVGLFPDPKALICRAHERGIVLLCNSCTLSESENTIKVLSSQDISYPVFAGVHPLYAATESFEESRLCKLAEQKLIAGIGECGLDLKTDYPLDKQIELLDRHLSVAKTYNLPLNLHIRGAHGQLLSLLKRFRGSVRGIIHNFTFSYELAKEYLDLGFLLSVGHHILNISPKLSSVLLRVGSDKIVLETDADYKHNAAYDEQQIKKEYESLGRLFRLEVNDVERTVEQNILNLLGK